MKDLIAYLRVLAMLEGISLLILLFIAMPLKYFQGLPVAVSVAGMIHGILFMLLLVFSSLVSQKKQWSDRFWFLVILSSMIPFATFFMDRKLRTMQENPA